MLKGQDYFANSFDIKKLDELEQMLQNRSRVNGKGFKHISVPQPPAKIKT
jgi:hypothetical protein